MPSKSLETEKHCTFCSNGPELRMTGLVILILSLNRIKIWRFRGAVTEVSCGSGNQSSRLSKMRLPIPNIPRFISVDTAMVPLSQHLLMSMFGSTAPISAVKRTRMESPVMDSDVRDVILAPFFRGRRCHRSLHRDGYGSIPFVI